MALQCYTCLGIFDGLLDGVLEGEVSRPTIQREVHGVHTGVIEGCKGKAAAIRREPQGRVGAQDLLCVEMCIRV